MGIWQVGEVARRLPGVEILHSDLIDLPPLRAWDLVVAVEVLMHIPPSTIQAAVTALRRASRILVTVDWTVPRDAVAPHCFLHDYPALVGVPVEAVRVGAQTLYRW